jgi:hypothetical protein
MRRDSVMPTPEELKELELIKGGGYVPKSSGTQKGLERNGRWTPFLEGIQRRV